MTRSQDSVVLAMSGGVDSSVAARLLLEAGRDVIGVFMCLGSAGQADVASGCCSPADAADARRVAQQLGIRLYVLDFSEDFAPIIDHFMREYARGRTPNPCVLCNSRIKFSRLVAHADRLGCRFVATGHHARRLDTPAGPAFARAACWAKDQSYALMDVPRASLPRVLLPVGELPDKQAVRDIARSLGLPVSEKPDSQEICFVPDDDYPALLRRRCPQAMRGGDIVAIDGRVLGRHDGYGQFTIGQRRGLGVAGGVPLYVVAIDPDDATVTLGPREALMSRRLTASGVNWHLDVDEEFDAIVQVRYNHRGAPARVRRCGGGFVAEFRQDVWAITPGQVAAVYRDDVLLGGGWIESAGYEDAPGGLGW